MEKLKPAEPDDLVKILTSDEFLVSMRILEVNESDGTILLGKPDIKLADWLNSKALTE